MHRLLVTRQPPYNYTSCQTYRAQELAQIKIGKDDVKLIVTEFEIDNKAADAKLRAHGGDLRETLVALLHEGLPTGRKEVEGVS